MPFPSQKRLLSPPSAAIMVGYTLLLVIVVAVSAAAIVETAARAVDESRFDLMRWSLLAVTLAGAALAMIRALSFYASRSLLAPVVNGSRWQTGAPRRSPAWERLPAVMDDATWAILAATILLLNVIAAIAAVQAVRRLASDDGDQFAWLVWQAVVLVAALAGLTRLTLATTRELRDRGLRHRRGFIRVLMEKLLFWPGGRGGHARRAVAASAVVLPCALAAMAWANAASPLLKDEVGSRSKAATGSPASPAGDAPRSRTVERRPSNDGGTAENERSSPIGHKRRAARKSRNLQRDHGVGKAAPAEAVSTPVLPAEGVPAPVLPEEAAPLPSVPETEGSVEPASPPATSATGKPTPSTAPSISQQTPAIGEEPPREEPEKAPEEAEEPEKVPEETEEAPEEPVEAGGSCPPVLEGLEVPVELPGDVPIC